MFKFGHIDMENEDNPVLWDKVSKDDFNLIMKCKNLYEQCLAYSGHNVHDVNGATGNLLNGADHFLFSFTESLLIRYMTLMDLIQLTRLKVAGKVILGSFLLSKLYHEH